MTATLDTIHALAQSLDGWCSIEKADALYDLVLKSKPKLIVEIGTFAGKTLFSMALPAKEIGGCTVISIDPWNNEASAVGQVEQTSEEWWRGVNHELIYQKFLWQVDKLGLKDVIEVHRQKSIDMEPPKNVDILHIDGNHGPDAVQDAERFAPNVKLGGHCILDDLGWTGGYVRLAEKHLLSIGFVKVKGNDDWAIYQRMEMGAPKVADKAAHPNSPLPTIEESLDAKLTVAFITSREKPEVGWFLDSLRNTGLTPKQIIIVSLHDSVAGQIITTPLIQSQPGDPDALIKFTVPKPTIWQGKHRITKDDWWAASNARNTAIALCKTEFIACFDDRCVVMPGYAEAVRDAIKGNYVMCGSYQKRINMKAENGFIVDGGTITGEDHRFMQHPMGLSPAPGEWVFGCNFALPIEYALAVNGFAEDYCDGMSFEDCIFGMQLHNNGFAIRYDPRARIIEDRTPSELGKPMLRTSKERFPNDTQDKCHKALAKLRGLKTSQNSYDLRTLRDSMLAGGTFPPSTAARKDWFDQQDIATFTAP